MVIICFYYFILGQGIIVLIGESTLIFFSSCTPPTRMPFVIHLSCLLHKHWLLFSLSRFFHPSTQVFFFIFLFFIPLSSTNVIWNTKREINQFFPFILDYVFIFLFLFLFNCHILYSMHRRTVIFF